jgi:PAS domain S-box-containing protein
MEFTLPFLVLVAIMALLLGWVLGNRDFRKRSGEKLLLQERETKQNITKQRLQQSESKYRTIVESIHSGFSLNELVYDDSGLPIDIKLLYANDKFRELYKLKDQEISDKRYTALFPDSDKNLIAKAFAVTTTGKSYTRLELTPSNKYIESVVYKADDHQFIRLDSDLTDRLSTESELQSSQQKFSGIYNLLPDMVGIIQITNLQFVECNPVFTELTGYTPEEYTGKTPCELGLMNQPENLIAIIEMLNKGEILRDFKYTMTTKSGNRISLLVSAQKINFENGGCFLFLCQHITERKKIEDTESNANLEKKIAERTAQLQQAIQDQEAFAYSISHDLRSPLRHIDGFLRLMIGKLDTQDQVVKGYFEKIYMASNRMSAMIDDLLTFSRLGRKELDIKRVDLNSLVNEVIDQYKIIYNNREIEWKVNLLPTIPCDANLFKTVFENLIANAIKYTSKKPLAEIEIGARDLPDNMAEVFIKDNGVGFNSLYATRLFRVFQRLHPSEEFSGTGIGLANVKQIITRHNGKVRADGVVNEGATFYLTLHK